MMGGRHDASHEALESLVCDLSIGFLLLFVVVLVDRAQGNSAVRQKGCQHASATFPNSAMINP
jgi:hypothetical protein